MTSGTGASETASLVGGRDAEISPHTKTTARLVLLFVAMLYGSLYVALRQIFLFSRAPSAPTVCVVKSTISAIAFVPALLAERRSRSASTAALVEVPPIAKCALALAVLSVVSNELIYAVDARIPASRTACLVQLSVVATPLIELAHTRNRQPTRVWFGAALALCGIAALSFSGGGGGGGGGGVVGVGVVGIGIVDGGVVDGAVALARHPASGRGTDEALFGDALVVCGALVCGVYLVATARAPSEGDCAMQLQALKTLIACAMYGAWALAQAATDPHKALESLGRGWSDERVWLLVAYAAVVPGALTDVLQQQAMASLRASEACLILASEPVWAALLSVPLLGEQRLEGTALLGAFLVSAAVVISSGALPETRAELAALGRRLAEAISSRSSNAAHTQRVKVELLGISPNSIATTAMATLSSSRV